MLENVHGEGNIAHSGQCQYQFKSDIGDESDRQICLTVFDGNNLLQFQWKWKHEWAQLKLRNECVRSVNKIVLVCLLTVFVLLGISSAMAVLCALKMAKCYFHKLPHARFNPVSFFGKFFLVCQAKTTFCYFRTLFILLVTQIVRIWFWLVIDPLESKWLCSCRTLRCGDYSKSDSD